MRLQFSFAVALAALTALPAHAGDCSVILNAMLAQARAPYSVDVTIAAKDKPPRTAKTVYTGSRLFVQMDGKWHSMAMDPNKDQAMIRKAEKAAQVSCRRQGSGTVNGKPAAIYKSHVVAPHSVSDNTVWLAGNRVLKTEVQVQGGPHIVSMFHYDHVTPPAGVK